MDSAGTVLAVAGGCRAVEAARDALPHPVRAAAVTPAHGRLGSPMDRIGCFVAMGLWPKRCVAGTARRDFAGWHPREACGLLPHCRRIAALPLRDRGAVRSPLGGLPSVGRSPVAAGELRLWPVGVALAGQLRFAPARVSPRRRPPSPPVRFVSHALAAWSRAGAAYGCPGSGVCAPCL